MSLGRRPLAVCALSLTLPLLGACANSVQQAPASPSGSPQDNQPVAIATTTQLGSILGDITQCAGTTSATLMGPGDDPHDFSVSSSEVAQLVKTKLVVANGLTLEGGLQSTLEGAQKDGARVYEVAPHLDPLSYEQLEAEGDAHGHEHADDHDHADDHEHADEHEHADDHGDHEGHHHGAYDPHVFLDAGRMAKAANLIGTELASATGDQKYVSCGQEVESKLQGTNEKVKQILSVVPEAKRVLITDHEAYNYFAKAYDFEVAGVVIPGGGTDAEPSSADLAKLVDVIKDEKVSAIFSNNATNPKVVQAVARETGTDVKVVELYVGSLGPKGSGADTYSGMMETNAQRIADALK